MALSKYSYQPLYDIATSSEVDEIITSKLPPFVKWGSIYIVSILAVLPLICWLVPYNETVKATAKLTTINSPKLLISKANGKIQSIYVQNEQLVHADSIIATIESTTDPLNVNVLDKKLDTLIQLLHEERINEIETLYQHYFLNLASFHDFGELQISYQTFIDKFIEFHESLRTGFYSRKKAILNQNLKILAEALSVLNSEVKLAEQDLSLEKENFNANQYLNIQKVISNLELRTEKSKFISKQRQLPQLQESMLTTRVQTNDILRQISELDNQVITQRSSFTQAIRTLQSSIKIWNYKYLIKAPISGQIVFNGFLQDFQEIKDGQHLFTIQPLTSSYYAEVLIPQYNFGKVRIHQQVHLTFPAYPYEQFGYVIGTINYISSISTDSGFWAKVSLPQPLLTSRGRIVKNTTGLTATASIILDKSNFLHKLIDGLSKRD